MNGLGRKAHGNNEGVMTMASPTIMQCDGLEWRLDDGGTLIVRDIGSEYWTTADTSHTIPAVIKCALLNVTMVKALIEEAATDRLKADQRLTEVIRKQR